MSSENKKLPSISIKKPLTSNKSFNLTQSIKIHNNMNNKKLIKKLNTTSRSISIKKANINDSNESEKEQNKNSSKKKNHLIKTTYRINNFKGNFLLYKKMCSLSSSEEKNKSKSKSKKNKIKKLKIHIVEEKNELKIYYYKIFKIGNDIKTIKKCFEHRENWQLAPESFKYNEINLIWAPLSCQVKYSELNQENISNKSGISTLVNHYEFHTQISNKLKMFKNLMIFCEENHLDLFSYVPLTILIEYQSPSFLRQFNGFAYVFNNITYLLAEPGMQKESKRKYRHYFYVDSDSDSKVGQKTTLYIPKNHYCGKNLWLIKAMNLNRGLAIKIIDSIESCENIVRYFYQGGIYKSVVDSEKMKDEEKEDTNKKVYFELPKILNKNNNNSKYRQFKNNHGFCLYRQIDYYTLLKKNNNEDKKKHYQSKKILLQKYIENPLLYNGRKFDMRIWVLLTHDMKVYLFKEGHLKATSYKFSLDNKDFFVHLTNYSVQKYSDNFAKFEIGNEISFDEFQISLKKDYDLNIDVRKDILNKIKKIVGISMKSAKKNINMNNRKGCFEIFGYDLMFDIDLNPYLIEINTNPGLEISSPLISKLVPRMIDDAFRLTIDVIFGTIYSSDRYGKDGYISPFHVDGYSDSENMFELVVDLNEK